MKRLLYILTHSKMQVVRLTLAIGSMLWAVQLFMPPQIFPTTDQIAAGTGRQTYALMATIAPEEVWAALFLVNGVWTMYSLMSGVTNRVTLAMDGFLGCVLWTASTTSCYLAYWPNGLGVWGALMTYPSPAAMSGDVALSLMAWWHMIRLWALDQPKDRLGGVGGRLLTRNAMATSGLPSIVTPSLMGDPTLQGLAWVVGIVALVIAIGKPIRDYIRQERRASKDDVVGDARSAAEVVLYNHLSEQVKEYRGIADAAFRERNELIQRVAALEVKSSDLEVAKDLVDRLKVRLDEKDAQIQSLIKQASEERLQLMKILSEKESEIQKREERISVLEGKTRDLELRLARDEARMSLPQCPRIDKPKFDEEALAG